MVQTKCRFCGSILTISDNRGIIEEILCPTCREKLVVEKYCKNCWGNLYKREVYCFSCGTVN